MSKKNKRKVSDVELQAMELREVASEYLGYQSSGQLFTNSAKGLLPRHRYMIALAIFQAIPISKRKLAFALGYDRHTYVIVAQKAMEAEMSYNKALRVEFEDLKDRLITHINSHDNNI